MRTFLIRRSRPTASALIIALVAFCANCLPAAEATAEEMACCAAMGDDCPMAQEHDCCAGETSKVKQGTVAKQLVFSPPSLVLVGILSALEPPQLQSEWNRDAIRSALKPPGIPTYLLNSTFRI